MASLSASETEFLAEQELILIMPQFHLRDNNGMLNFIGGNFGPFQPGITTHVPLWLAIMLKQLNKCRILPPSWLSVDYLTSQLEREKKSEVFEELPFHYLEVASLLLKNAPDDLDQGEHLRSLLEDLQNVRQDKIRNGLTKIATDVQGGGTALAIQMNNISALEINSMREFMLGVTTSPNRSRNRNRSPKESWSPRQKLKWSWHLKSMELITLSPRKSDRHVLELSPTGLLPN
ncbi:DNA replication complex GINS protein PSF2, putative [Phytophthora infestans T30-4]|uniref:DNA replication complex GINS protein PSF2, putative n=1 Tax=Phytophthora infestans (strain T30-4) TaxID=403677 RepID=D0NFF4_PHYIT|nr:DNA replication complex GINS protein PSF2, putative [Phytophthora infestans T30-4]EEY56943.1 DNA replication complex GINS protein PSF2, putative [Phytophthora infestans T30-4]|eukprot:XP_002902271.1 DNA replication complex GINS protein PSF2, putative [Phytophthora infestans T30-4]